MKKINKEHIKTIKNYVKASELFNNKNKDYKIEILQDFDSLHIYIHDVVHEKYDELIILNNCITYLSIKELVHRYYELVDYLFKFYN